MTASQRLKTMKKYEARRHKVNELFEFYLRNNILHKDMEKDESVKRIVCLTERDIQKMTIVQ